MSELKKVTEEEIRDLVFDFFSEECDMDRAELTKNSNIIEELEGDSLMLMALLEIVRKKYGLNVELKTLGMHLMKKPANTIGQVITLTLAIVEFGDDIVHMEL